MRYSHFNFVICLSLMPAMASGSQGYIGPPAADLRCSVDGKRCIGLKHYYEDACALIEQAAEENDLDAGYFARLLWRESRYDPAAVSPVGAQGIAQFMPATARLRALDDPFNPAQAIEASAQYLAEMIDRYGNPGLAAIGYNGGEARVASFIAKRGGLAGETRAYVHAITGHRAEGWRDDPPSEVDYRLDGDTPFRTACVQMAKKRSIREFRDPPPPWGVVVAAGRTMRSAEMFGHRAAKRHSSLIDASALRFIRTKMPGGGTRAQPTAQVAASTRAEALGLCRRIRGQGGFCKVVRN
ncbi:lytic transglycosylase domain-containing protein [Rhodobacteraceae bacterium]|nr:lytic transglycosylase domain-containing protein [Paracoccaceae bacterium]